jgi:hypothetical protein
MITFWPNGCLLVILVFGLLAYLELYRRRADRYEMKRERHDEAPTRAQEPLRAPRATFSTPATVQAHTHVLRLVDTPLHTRGVSDRREGGIDQ